MTHAITNKPGRIHRARVALWKNRKLCRIVGLACCLTAGSAAICAAETPEDDFTNLVAPFLQRHCLDCHGENEPEAKFSLHGLSDAITAPRNLAEWRKVAERLALNEMPPEGEPRPDPRQAAAVLQWLKDALVRGGEDVSAIGSKLALPGHGNRVEHEALFSGQFTDPVASSPRLWRLRPQVYASFVPRVGGRAKFGQPFSSHSGEGFKDYAELFVVDEPTIGQLLRNARQIVAIQCSDSLSATPHKEFLALLDERREPTDNEFRAAVARQFQLVLLREPTSAETSRFVDLMKKNIAVGGRRAGVEGTLATVLMLPAAFYRSELGQVEQDEHGRALLAPRELAYAIAFALTDAAPDAALLQAVAAGQLATRAEVRLHVERLLNDSSIEKPRIRQFFEEYFEYPAAEEVFKDLKMFYWRPDVLVNDTHLLIEHILNEDRDVFRQLLTTNKSFVNARSRDGKLMEVRPLRRKAEKDKRTGKQLPLSPRDPDEYPWFQDWYSLPVDWQWTAQQPVTLPSDQRAGILTQPSWLAAFATNNENHAIRRGKWVRERLLGGVVPDVPISVDAQLPDAPEKTLRERMEVTREDYCWQCHQKMNPLGLLFEHYNYLGRYRDREPVLDPVATAANVDKQGKPLGPVMRRVPLDASGVVRGLGDAAVEGEYNNFIELIHKLADSPRVRQVFVRHAFRYWMGRNETLNDSPTLVAADNAYVASGGSMKALITSLLTSDSFLYRRIEKPLAIAPLQPASSTKGKSE